MKKLTWVLFLLMWLLAVIAVFQYFFCPQYNFQASSPFSGSLIYNPYVDDDFSGWYKCNFHAHVHAWLGLTNGKGTAADACSRYESLGYDVYCVSNYQQVEDYHREKPGYIEAYEHGYGLIKNHHTVLGTTEVVWREYLFPQTLSNKQHILSTLQEYDSAVIIINHPAIRNAFPPGDFAFLAGYDGLELYPSGSMQTWDAALSAGRPVWAMANDDTHNINDPAKVGRYCTWIGAATLTKENILSALKTGRSYSMVIAYEQHEGFEKKIARVKKGLPSVRQVRVQNDSLTVSVSDSAAIQFIGQHGKVLATQENCTFSSYQIKPDDTYIRTRIFFHDGNEINLNPVFRYDGKIPELPMPAINITNTRLLRLAGVITIALISFIPLIIHRRRLKQNMNRNL